MSAIPVVAAGTINTWRCNACGSVNEKTVRVASAGASVPCARCGAFNAIAAATATSARGAAATVPVVVVGGGGGAAAAAATATRHAATANGIPVVTTPAPLSLEDEAVVQRFQSFLRIPTVANEGATNGANESAVAFLKSIGESMGLRSAVYRYAPNQPLLVLTLPGSDPTLSSLLLNSHYDVVPVMRERWSVDPFAADIQADGRIIARGAQDMKPVCMQYLEALLRLLRGPERVANFARTVHLSFMPDEETGGEWGMQKWVETPEFKALNVGFALDEGIANSNDEFTVFYGERGVWWLTLKAAGPTGHASRFVPGTATSKLMRSVQHFLDYRDLQEQKLLGSHADHGAECAHAVSAKLALGDVVTINLTVLKAGVTVDGGKSYSMNVIPMEAEAGFDLRLPPHVDLSEFESMVREWTAEEGLSYSVRKFSAEYVTSISEEDNPFWKAFKASLGESCGTTKVVPQIFPAGTDSRFLRKALIPVIGFSPLSCTPVLLHDHDEFVSVPTYLRGVGIYQKLIPALANLAVSTSNEAAVYLQPKQKLDVLPAKGGAATAAAPAAVAASDSSAPHTASVSVGSDAPSSGVAVAATSQTDALAATPIPTQTEAPAVADPIPTQTETSSATAAPVAAQPIATQTEA